MLGNQASVGLRNLVQVISLPSCSPDCASRFIGSFNRYGLSFRNPYIPQQLPSSRELGNNKRNKLVFFRSDGSASAKAGCQTPCFRTLVQALVPTAIRGMDLEQSPSGRSVWTLRKWNNSGPLSPSKAASDLCWACLSSRAPHRHCVVPRRQGADLRMALATGIAICLFRSPRCDADVCRPCSHIPLQKPPTT